MWSDASHRSVRSYTNLLMELWLTRIPIVDDPSLNLTPPLPTQELYSSLEKMQPSLFLMASELKPKEEGMAEILQANDSLIRVMDRYKKIMGESTGIGEFSLAFCASS